MRVPLDLRLVPLAALALGVAVLFALRPDVATVVVWSLLGLLVLWLFFRVFSRPPRIPTEALFWPSRHRASAGRGSKFFHHEPRPDTDR